MHVRAASVLPLEPQPVVSSSKDSSVEGPEELHDSMVEEPVGEGWVVNDSLRAVLDSGLLGQMSRASSGHWRSAALWVKKTVGRPRVSTMERRRLR